MASLPGTVKQQQAPTEEEKPRIICEIEYFGPEDFSVLPESKLHRSLILIDWASATPSEVLQS